MKRAAKNICKILALLWSVGSLAEVHAQEKDYSKIVSIGGSVTEIIYALGEEERLIARDTTSVYPKEAFSLPDVGYIRQLSAEGVLSVNPDLIIMLDGSGPPEALEALSEAKIPVVVIPEGFNAEKIQEKILAVGKALGVMEKAEVLAEQVKANISRVTRQLDEQGKAQKALFVLTMQGGKVMAAGKNTAADGILKLSGAQNIMSQFEGYKPVSDESIILGKPDVIVMMNRRGGHAQDNSEILAQPAIAETPAGKNGKIVRMDGLYLLGFGPRTADAISDLNKALKH